MPGIDRYYAAACQTDLPCPRHRDEIAGAGRATPGNGRSSGRRLRAVLRHQAGGFPEFAHAAPIYETAAGARATGSPCRSPTNTPTAT